MKLRRLLLQQRAQLQQRPAPARPGPAAPPRPLVRFAASPRPCAAPGRMDTRTHRRARGPLLGPPAAVSAWLGALDERTPRSQPADGASKPHVATARVIAPLPPQQQAAAAGAEPQPPQPDGEPTLIHQRLAVRRARYAAPRVMHPQASQLVGLLFTLLGAPAFKPSVPGVRHPNTEGKYELLRLLWQRAERLAKEGPGSGASGAGGGDDYVPADAEEADWLRREAEVVSTMTVHLRESLRKVLSDPLVPQEARDVAVARLREREANVARGLRAWFDAAAARPDFEGVVLPLLRAVLAPLEASGLDATQDARGGPGSATNGDLMEARTLAAVGAQLPPGWRLLPKAHVVALDGRHPGHAAACKWEADLVALDETGTAVAIFEAKLANANPLMTLLTDAGRCIALVGHLAVCRTVTLRIRAEDLEDAARYGGGAVAAAGVPAAASGISLGSANSGGLSGDEGEVEAEGEAESDGEAEGEGEAAVAELELYGSVKGMRKLRKQRRQAAAKAKKLWRDVEVPVDPRLQPVYVIGRPLRPKDLARGLASMASAEALKLATRDPAALVAGLQRHAAGAAAGEGGEGSEPGPETPRSSASSGASFGSLVSVGSGFSGTSSAASAPPDDGVRLTFALPEEWRAAISDKVLSRLDLLVNRVTILAMDRPLRQPSSPRP